MYIKIFGSLLLIGSATAMGFLKSEELGERVKKLKEFKRMIMLLQGEIRFHRGTLSEAFGNVSIRLQEPMKVFLNQMAERLEAKEGQGFEEIWKEESESFLMRKGFCKADERLLELLGSGLGYLDLSMQMETMDLVLFQTEDAIRVATEEKTARGRLYQTMGVTVGAMLTLLII